MVWWLSLMTASAQTLPPPTGCATLQRLAEAPPLVRLPIEVPIGGTISRELRNPYNTPNVELSEHFAVHWGDSGGVSAIEVTRLLEALEESWAVQVDTLAHPAPATSQQYYFNVYIGDSGDGAPLGYGAGGYYSPDFQGYPMLVVAAGTLNSPAYADHTAAHEFYHAIQGSLNRYPYEGESAWFWEATAEWAAIHTDPSNPTAGTFVFAYALLPDHAVNFFDYPDDSQLQNYYQYGAFLFPMDVDRATGGPELIRDAWLDTSFTNDPLTVIDRLLDDQGLVFDEVFLDHLEHLVTWDYDQGSLFALTTQQAGLFYPGADTIFDELDASGTGGPRVVDADDAPMRYGFTALYVDAPDDGTLVVSVAGEPTGTLGSDARFGGRLLVVEGGVATSHPITMDASGLVGSAEVPLQGADEAYLLVGALTDRGDAARFDSERFPFTYELAYAAPIDTGTVDTGGITDTGVPSTPTVTSEPTTSTTEPTVPTDEGSEEAPASGSVDEAKGGCGCASAGGAAGGWAAGLMLLALRRRR